MKAPPRPTLLASSSQLTLLEQARIPHAIDSSLAVRGLEQLRPTGGTAALLWRTDIRAPLTAASIVGGNPTTSIPVFASVLADELAEPMLAARGGSWHPERGLYATAGERVGSIWRGDDGSVFIPFDPNEVVVNYLSEQYLAANSRPELRELQRKLLLGYYRARPLVPRPLQISMRRQFVRLQARSSFPRWPIETGLHDFFDLMFAILGGVAGEPIPHIASWPDGHAWALVLTHDVERLTGMSAMDRVLDLERAHGVRSSWNVVPRDYFVDPARLRELADGGFEVGVHGMHHDGRDLESLARWQQRLPAIREAAASWGATGFRSASLHRRWDWMQLLEFDYDSSYPDTDPFAPQIGGCCTWLPFFNGDLVELPLTLAQDHTLFVILRQADETAWVQKTEFLRERGGMALIDTHPDYMVDDQIFSAYDAFLRRFVPDPTAWKALPREVSAWWRRRASSTLERDGDDWRIVGPAAGEGRIEFLGGPR